MSRCPPSSDPAMARFINAIGPALRIAGLAFFATPLGLSLGQGAAVAQDASAPQLRAPAAVVTLDPDRFFRDSAWGRAAIARLEGERDVLAAENRRIEEALQKEEQALTDRRANTAADEFSRLARDFDTRVEGIRKAQDAKSQAFAADRDAEQRAFFAAAGPVLKTMLDETGASAILASGAVLMASTDTDITAEAILRMDRAYPEPLPREQGLEPPDLDRPAPPQPQPQTPEPSAPAPEAPEAAAP